MSDVDQQKDECISELILLMVLQVTAAGFALDLGSAAQQALGDKKMNMLDARHKEDREPLVQDCLCFTCRNHTRAYVHHLLLVHEMTAQILLELHNVHQLLQWFASIRTAISSGSFAKLRQQDFAREQAPHLSSQ